MRFSQVPLGRYRFKVIFDDIVFLLSGNIIEYILTDKKEEIWLSPMTKGPTPTEMPKGQSDNTNIGTKKFD